MERLPYVKSSQTEKNHVLEDECGRENNTLAVDINDGNKEQAPRYLQREREKPKRYVYIARKGPKVGSPSIEEVLD